MAGTVSSPSELHVFGIWYLTIYLPPDKFTDEDKKRFASDPVAFAAFRREMEDELNSVHEVTIKGSGMQVGAVSAFREASELRPTSLGGDLR